jgi:hypothetical protein
MTTNTPESAAARRTPLELFHIGIVVPNLAAGMDELGELLGLTWGRVQLRTGSTMTASGPVDVDTSLVWSIQGPPHFELFQQQSGTPWATVGLDHLGMYCDDLNGEGAHLIDRGAEWESGKYFRSRSGLRHELGVRATTAPRLARYIAGGDLLDAGGSGEYFQHPSIPIRP